MELPKDNSGLLFEDCEPATLFREFAAECIELAQTNPSPEKARAVYENGRHVASNGAALGEKRSAIVVGTCGVVALFGPLPTR